MAKKRKKESSHKAPTHLNKEVGKSDKKGPKFSFYWVYGLILVVLIGIHLMNSFSSAGTEITWNKFKRELLFSGDIDKIIVVKERELVEVYLRQTALQQEKYRDVARTSLGMVNTGPHYVFTIPSIEVFERNMEEAQKDIPEEKRILVSYETRRNWLTDSLSWLIPIAIFVLIWIFILRRVSGGIGGPGGQIFNIGKSKATLFDKDSTATKTFDDVAGLDEAKEEVKEIVDFLKNPKKYTALGGKIPKGVLLVGPPGTGKTLLAKAMAGEAQVPFFSISGSDFVELFVGVGASRVRDLFRQASEKAPCIIFIDEIDAIGRQRGKVIIPGGNDERESTLNALLVEMDGFSSEAGIIILAATNRPDVLDPALLRPGRFDRQIVIDRPDIKGREEIFKVHLKPLKLDKNVDVKKLAALTPGFAGAEIANVCNEAALIAARKNKKMVEMDDFQDAIDKVIGGLEKKNKIISPEEKKIVAYHEAGHAIVGWFLEHASPLLKVSIIPRGITALGYAQYLPKEQYLYTKEQLLDNVCMALGGRAAEDIIFGKVSTGAQNDLERITRIIYDMVTLYGMDDKIGPLSFNDPKTEYAFNKPYSDETARMIDEQVRQLAQEAYVRTKALLLEKRAELEKLAQALLKKEVLFVTDLEEILGKRPFEPHYDMTHWLEEQQSADKNKATMSSDEDTAVIDSHHKKDKTSSTTNHIPKQKPAEQEQESTK